MYKISAGHYRLEYRRHKIELIDLRRLGGKPGWWIAPIDGSNDIEPRMSRQHALEAAKRTIDAELRAS